MVLVLNQGINYTSTDEFCESCHMHPHATKNWRLSTHFDNKSGVIVHCVECHLPPEGIPHLSAKATTGLRDLWATLVKDADEIDWLQKSTREAAVNHVYKKACVKCHQNLFSQDLSKKGEDAHLYYDQRPDELRCINCHIDVGHFRERKEEIVRTELYEIYTTPAEIDSFENFTEKLPGTTVDFEMIAPTGQFHAVETELLTLSRQVFGAEVGPLASAEGYRSCHVITPSIGMVVSCKTGRFRGCHFGDFFAMCKMPKKITFRVARGNVFMGEL